MRLPRWKEKMKPPKKIKKQSERGRLKTEIDTLFRAYILETRPHICQWCNRPAEGRNLHVSHILPRGSHPKLRWVELNILLLCLNCHLQVWHKNPILAHEFMVRIRGEDYKQKLLLVELMKEKQTMFYLRNLKMWYELEAKDKGGKNGIPKTVGGNK